MLPSIPERTTYGAERISFKELRSRLALRYSEKRRWKCFSEEELMVTVTRVVAEYTYTYRHRYRYRVSIVNSSRNKKIKKKFQEDCKKEVFEKKKREKDPTWVFTLIRNTI